MSSATTIACLAFGYLVSDMDLCFGYINVFKIFYIAQFILACSAIRTRFRTINQKFKYINKPTTTLNLRKCFHGLSDAILIINDTFTSQFIFLFINIMVNSRRTFTHNLDIFSFDNLFDCSSQTFSKGLESLKTFYEPAVSLMQRFS